MKVHLQQVRFLAFIDLLGQYDLPESKSHEQTGRASIEQSLSDLYVKGCSNCATNTCETINIQVAIIEVQLNQSHQSIECALT